MQALPTIPEGKILWDYYVTFYYVIFFRCCNHWAQRKLYFTNRSPEWCPASNYDRQCDWWNIGHSNQISRDQIGQTFQGQNWRWKCSVSCLITILALVQASAAISFDSAVIRITWLRNRIQVSYMIFRFRGYLWFFSSEQCPEGIVAIAGNTLRILALEKLGAIFNQGIVYQSGDPWCESRTKAFSPMVTW